VEVFHELEKVPGVRRDTHSVN